MKTLAYGASLLLSAIVLINSVSVQAQQPLLDELTIPDSKPQNSSQPIVTDEAPRPLLTGEISESQYLPTELYGTWQVTQKLLSTNAPQTFRQQSYDILIFQQAEDRIRLYNPDTHSDTYITVNEVKNNTATFTCQSNPNKKYTQIERVTITVNGDKFSGNNIYQLQYFKKNHLVRIEQALFMVSGARLSGPRLNIFDKNR